MMKLYAIRDRLIGYYMTPFPGPSDHQVKAAVANNVNNGGDHGINKAPHQFELWRLAGFDEETGKVTGEPEYLCDLASLVRRGVREGGDAGETTLPGAPGGGPREAGNA